jgi:hypothetical protein
MTVGRDGDGTIEARRVRPGAVRRPIFGAFVLRHDHCAAARA